MHKWNHRRIKHQKINCTKQTILHSILQLATDNQNIIWCLICFDYMTSCQTQKSFIWGTDVNLYVYLQVVHYINFVGDMRNIIIIIINYYIIIININIIITHFKRNTVKCLLSFWPCLYNWVKYLIF